jgi:2-iminobutanoate/2-iminopropanoate deaminase
MKLRRAGQICIIVLAGGVTACSSVSERLWVPQQPGNYNDEPVRQPPSNETRAQAQPASASTPTTAASASAAMPVTRSAPPAPASQSAAANDHGAEHTYVQARRYGDLLFLSGQIATDAQSNELPAGLTAGQQTDIVMQKIAAILASHRLTLANVVQTTVYLASINDLSEMNAAYERHFRGELPARTVVEVANLPRGARVQIAVVAGR